MRRNQAPEALRRSKERHSDSGLKDGQWDPFLLDYKGDVDTLLTAQTKTVGDSVASWKGTAPAKLENPNLSYIRADADLERQPLAVLDAEIERIQKQVNVDRDTAARFAALTKKIAEENTALNRLTEKRTDSEGARGRAEALVQQREDSYKRIFKAVLDEQAVLVTLYAPLMERLDAAQGTLQKLHFSVQRIANLDHWAAAGEELFDLRRAVRSKARARCRSVPSEPCAPRGKPVTRTPLAPRWQSFETRTRTDFLRTRRWPKRTRRPIEHG